MNNKILNNRGKKLVAKVIKSEKKDKRHQVGAIGEALVAKHLAKKGFTHLESNYRKPHGELDLILEFKGVIHFFEVKTVSREMNFTTDIVKQRVIRETEASEGNNGISLVNRETPRTKPPKDHNHTPEENVTPLKIKKISKVVKVYLAEKGWENKDWQFNVASVFLDSKNKKAYIKFIKDIPLCD